MIERNPQAAAEERYELIVVGGGVYGISLLLESARRGMRTLLIDRGDFGGGTSWNSLRIMHGGLRYLQSLDLRRFRESVAERRRWLLDFPDLVRPLPCLMPLYDEGLRRPLVLRAALATNDRLSGSRNDGVRADRVLPDGRLVDVAETVRRYPGADRKGLRGGALWHDGVVDHPQRLLMEMLHWATAMGARTLNYVEATGIQRSGGRVTALDVRDRVDGRESRLRTSAVVCCAGPWGPELARRLDSGGATLYPPSIAFNVLLDRPAPSRDALAVSARRPGAKTFFLYPWRDATLAGTAHAVWTRPIEPASVDGALLGRFLEELAAAAPGLEPRPRDVARVLWGFLPAARPGVAELADRETILHHAPQGGTAGVFSVAGVKFTTARLVAEKTLAALWRWRGGEPPAPVEFERPVASGWSTWPAWSELATRDPESATAQLRSLIDRESVVHLDDLLLRRTDWGISETDLPAIAKRVAPLTGWAETRVRAELERLGPRSS